MTSGRRCIYYHDATSRRFQMFLVHLSGGFLKSEKWQQTVLSLNSCPWWSACFDNNYCAATALHRKCHAFQRLPNVYPQCIPDVILHRSFTRPSTALDDWRTGNEATCSCVIPPIPAQDHVHDISVPDSFVYTYYIWTFHKNSSRHFVVGIRYHKFILYIYLVRYLTLTVPT